jgi:hypothetical protein
MSFVVLKCKTKMLSLQALSLFFQAESFNFVVRGNLVEIRLPKTFSALISSEV